MICRVVGTEKAYMFWGTLWESAVHRTTCQGKWFFFLVPSCSENVMELWGMCICTKINFTILYFFLYKDNNLPKVINTQVRQLQSLSLKPDFSASNSRTFSTGPCQLQTGSGVLNINSLQIGWQQFTLVVFILLAKQLLYWAIGAVPFPLLASI